MPAAVEEGDRVGPVAPVPSVRSVVMVGAGPLTDAEDDELRGLQGRDSDQDDEAAVVDVVLGHGGAVAPDEELLLRLVPDEPLGLPELGEEVLDLPPDLDPDRLPVGLEDHPLETVVDG